MLRPSIIPVVTEDPAASRARPRRRPHVASVVGWTLLGWVMAFFLIFLPQWAWHLRDLEVPGSPWVVGAEGAPGPLEAGVWLVSIWGTAITLHFALPRTADGGRVGWTWIIGWVAVAGLAMFLPGAWWVLGVGVAAVALRWLAWLPDGSARPEPLGIRGGAAWALNIVVIWLAYVLVLVG